MASFIYPTTVELIEIAQEKLPRLTQDRLGFKLLPLKDRDKAQLEWVQKDDYKGLQRYRGLNGEPTRVDRVGAKKYRSTPGAYGEFIAIDERELTTRRNYATFDQPINIDDLVMEAQDELLLRRVDRQELTIWNLLTTGIFSVTDLEGLVVHTDSYSLTTYTAIVAWATVATAQPIADFRLTRLLSRGKGVKFDSTATAYMNATTANSLLSNMNASDLYGRRTNGIGTLNNLGDVNSLLIGDGLPKLEIYDETYISDSGTVTLFIPNNKVVLVGSRPAGQSIGEYQLTQNANNADLGPGAYQKVIDTLDRDVPRQIAVHDGHNGGPVMFYPGSVIIMTV